MAGESSLTPSMREPASISGRPVLEADWGIPAAPKIIRSQGKPLLLGNLTSAHAQLNHKRIKKGGKGNLAGQGLALEEEKRDGKYKRWVYKLRSE